MLFSFFLALDPAKLTVNSIKSKSYTFSADPNYNYPEKKPFLLHRISIKNTTPFSIFSAIINGDTKAIRKQIIRSKLKQRIIRVFGTKIINNLNILKSKF
jgi:hypothetical protein